jgi:hypothetical protein
METETQNILDQGMDATKRLSGDAGTLLESRITSLYVDKRNALAKEIELSADKMKLDEAAKETYRNLIFNSLSNRFIMAMKLAGKEDDGAEGGKERIDSIEDIRQYWDSVDPLLSDLNPKEMIFLTLLENPGGFYGSLLDYYTDQVKSELGANQAVDVIQRLSELQSQEEVVFDAKDFNLVGEAMLAVWSRHTNMRDYLDQIKEQKRDARRATRIGEKAMEEPTPLLNPRVNLGILMFANLPDDQRMQMMQHLLSEPDLSPQLRPHMAQILTSLALQGYLSTEQSLALLEKADSLNAVEPLESRIAKNRLISPEARRAKKILARKEEAIRKIHGNRHVGHKLRAKELFSLKGLASALLVVNGGLTLAANALMNIHSPGDLLTSPGMAAGAGMMVAGLEVNDGFGGLLKVPHKLAASALEPKVKEKENDQKKDNFRAELGNHPLESRFYYHHAGSIVAAYQEVIKKGIGSGTQITLEDLKNQGLDLKKEALTDSSMRKFLEKVSEKDLGKLLFVWARRFDVSFSAKDASSQKTLMGEFRVKEHLEPDYPPLSQLL